MRACVRACVIMCVRAYVRACVRACVRTCVCVHVCIYVCFHSNVTLKHNDTNFLYSREINVSLRDYESFNKICDPMSKIT